MKINNCLVKEKEHPEIKEIKNICEVIPNHKDTKAICNKFHKNRRKENV